jgi:hypothetical protein
VFKLFICSGGVFIEYLVSFLDAYSRQGEYVLQQDQWKIISSLTLMSKGEKGVEFESSKCFECRGESEWLKAGSRVESDVGKY